jgi:NitT/TauT family transport system substrate-binding protein
MTGIGTRPREEYIQVGLAKGYFQAAGLTVTVENGAPSDYNIQKIVAGKAQFATIDFVSAIHGVMTPGFVDKYRIVAAIQERTLIAFISLPDRGISLPGDLAGKTLGIPTGSAAETLLPAYAQHANFDFKKIKQIVHLAPDQLPTDLAAGRIDAMSAYSIDTPTVKAAAPGQEPVVLPYDKYLTDLYGTVLIVDKNLCDFFPDMVKRFATALIKGLRYAVDHLGEASLIIKHAVPTTDVLAAAATMKLMQPYVGTGALDPTRVMRGIASLEQVKLAPSGLQPEHIVAIAAMPKVA